ncbi:hypothetical protein ACRALDRAFT_1061118 [Sodiomyces alcalophilus JCM 7366]|uniref:uncharacterized protein n=1 Tax=Sodiomyces alcalophilus JCM 7366 TaxID=591952 RepID=UPI0039B6BECD
MLSRGGSARGLLRDLRLSTTYPPTISVPRPSVASPSSAKATDLFRTTTPVRAASQWPDANDIQVRKYPQPQAPLPVSQAQAREALLNKLTLLTPAQITTLLSTPADALPSFPASRPPGRRRFPRWLGTVMVALIATVLGYNAGVNLVDESVLRSFVPGPVEPGDSDDDLDEAGNDHQGGRKTPDLPVGDRYLAPNVRALSAWDLANWYPLTGSILPTSFDELYPPPVTVFDHTYNSADPDADLTPSNWAAHAVPVVAVTREEAARTGDPLIFPPPDNPYQRHHYVARTLGTKNTLGSVYQVYRDPRTDQLSVLVQFGSGLSGPLPDVVHSGAVATVMDEAMARVAGRHLLVPAPEGGGKSCAIPFTAHLEVDHLDVVYPKDMVVVRMAPASAEWVATREARLRRGKKWVAPDTGGNPGPRFAPDALEEFLYPTTFQKDDGKDKTSETTAAMTATADDKDDAAPRKMWVTAKMVKADTGDVVCEATGLFVIPEGTDPKRMNPYW